MSNKPDTEKYNKVFDLYVQKAREEEAKRIKEQEKLRIQSEKKAKEERIKNLVYLKREEENELKKQKRKEELEKNGKKDSIKKLASKLTTKNNEIELKAKQKVLKEQFENKEAKPLRFAKPILFNYIAKKPNGEIENNTIEASSKVDVYSFLLQEGYEVYDITVAKGPTNITITPFKLKTNRLVFYLSQLSAYLKSGIALADSVKILYDQAKKKSERATWKSVYYDLSMGDVLSVALDKRGDAFPKLLVNMIKTAEMTGNLTDTLDDMVDYYTEVEATAKQMKSAMTYPVVILSFAAIVVVFLLVGIIPKFEDIFKSLGAEPPLITQIILKVSDFLNPMGKSHSMGGVIILAILIFTIIIFVFSYKNSRQVRKSMQEFAMHLPVFGDMIIYNEVSIFSKTFANLINHNVFITDSIGILSKITNNEIYKKLIYKTSENLNKGDPISKAFENHWAFPNIAYQMLITGEKTGRLGPMMEKVAEYYSEQHRNIINSMKSLIEPILIITLAVVVGFILMSVILPMFSMYDKIN